MKKISVFPSLIILISALSSVQLRADITNGLVARWLLDGNANDSIGTANGSPAGVTYSNSTVAGMNRLVANFDGASSIAVPETASLDLTNTFTIAGWFKVSAWVDSGVNGGYRVLHGGSSSAGCSVGMTIYSLDLNVWGEPNYTTAHQRAFSPPPDQSLGVVLNDWYHIAWTYDGTVMRQFLNGSELTNNISYAGASNINPFSDFEDLFIGAAEGSTPAFVGQMSDLLVYNRALSTSEVSVVANPSGDEDVDGVTNYRELADGTDPNNATSFNPLSVDLVAYYPFDGNANDESGFGNNGSAINLSYTNGRNTHLGNSAYFDGSAGISVPESQSLNLPSNFSISLWVNVATWDGYDDNNGHPILAAGGSPNVAEVAFGGSLAEWSSDFWLVGANDYPANSSYYLSRASSPTADFNNLSNLEKLKVLPGEWRKLTWTYDGNTIRSYLDGEMLQPASYSNSTNISPYLGWGTLRIGFNLVNQHLRGGLDDFRIYNRTLTPNEVKQYFYSDAFDPTQRQFLEANPTLMGHYSRAEYNANRTNGQADVTTNPAAFNLFTQSQYESFGALQFSNGISSVISNPSSFNLFTQQDLDSNRTIGQSDVINNPMSYGLYTADSIMDLRMGGLMIQRQGTNAVVSFQPQTTTDLTLPFTNNGTPITNTIPMPGNKGFIRINAKP